MFCQAFFKTKLFLICLLSTVACQQASTSKDQTNKTTTSPTSVASSVQTAPDSRQRVFVQYSSEQRDCWNRPGATQLEAVDCAESDLKLNKDKLERLVIEIKIALNDPNNKSPAIDLPSDTAAQLDDLQLSWQNLVESQCKWERNFLFGSSAAPMAYISCMATKTKNRVQELRVFLCKDQGREGVCKSAEKY